MAIDAGAVTYQMPAMNATTSATPAVSLVITFVGAAIKGGFLITEDSDLVEAGCVYAVAATSAVVWKLQLCRDTQIGNAADILGVAVGGVQSASCTAPAATTAVGSTLLKRYNFRLAKGDVVLINVTTGAAGAGQGYFYIKTYPRGEATLPTKLQGATTISTFASST